MDTRVRLQTNMYVGFSKIYFYLRRFLGYRHKKTLTEVGTTAIANETSCLSGYLFKMS